MEDETPIEKVRLAKSQRKELNGNRQSETVHGTGVAGVDATTPGGENPMAVETKLSRGTPISHCVYVLNITISSNSTVISRPMNSELPKPSRIRISRHQTRTKLVTTYRFLSPLLQIY